MQVQLAVLADGANIAPPGKLNILGIFDTIFAGDFPAVHPYMVLALRLRLEYEDGAGEHDLEVVLTDEDGKEFMHGKAKARVPKIPLDTGTGWPAILVYHGEHPDLNVVLQPSDELHSAVSLRAVTIIDTLIERTHT